MGWVNYHSHCHYCDGQTNPEAYAKSCWNKGLIAYGFSSHAPLPFPNSWAMKPDKMDDYIKEVEELKLQFKDNIQLYTGLETDYIPDSVNPGQWKESYPQIDYVIGSVHFVDEFKDGKPWEIDGAHDVFLKGLEKIFKGDIKAVISRYFALIREMVANYCPDVVGHLDKIKIQNKDNKFFEEYSSWYQKEVVKTLQCIKEAGTIVEVNTRGIYTHKTHSPYPSRWIIEKMLEMDIPLTLSSDAHHPEEVISHFERTAFLLSEIGVKKLRIFYNHKWLDTSFDSHGILLSDRMVSHGHSS